MEKLWPVFAMVALFVCIPSKLTSGQGVYLSLKGVNYTNNSFILIDEIEQFNTTTNNGLQCITDKRPCCSAPCRVGWWFFPDNGGQVINKDRAITFYRSRHNDGTVNLNRLKNDIMMLTGKFCCVVPDADDVNQTLCANIVSVNVEITSFASPTAGETFSLDCSLRLNGTSNNATFLWLKGSENNRTHLTSDVSRIINSNLSASQLQFSPLKVSHGGLYTCQAVVVGIVVEDTTTVTVNINVPVGVTVNPPVHGTIIAGSSLILNCIVELSLAVDISVTVDTVWSGPALTSVTTTDVIKDSPTRYIILGMVDEARNGSYTCQATVSSTLEFTTGRGMMSGLTTITVGPLPSPTNLFVPSQSPPTNITLTWDQPLGADTVTGYRINYAYEVIECSKENPLPFPPVTVTLNNGSLRTYTIIQSLSFPVNEDSNYMISVTSVNSVTESCPSNTVYTTSAQAAPGVVQSLRIGSVNVTNITIQWDRVVCLDRNGHTDSYRVRYYPTSDPYYNGNTRLIAGTSDDDRKLTITGLPPRTSYTFEVYSVNSHLFVRGVMSTLIVNTLNAESIGFLLNGQLYPNNSVVTLTDIRSVSYGPEPTLFCLTPNTECCSDTETPNDTSITREWYLPDGRLLSSAGTAFSREHVSSAVSLNRIGGPSLTGVFRCDIPDANGSVQNIFIGIYFRTEGSPSIILLLFDIDKTTLTCTSTGGPPTTLTWSKNGVDIPVNNSLYQQSQRVVNTETATYENVLFSNEISNFDGTFSCKVSNVRGTAQETVVQGLNGVSIVLDQFIAGQSATATCRSDISAATRIEWLTNKVLLKSTNSMQQLDLVFLLVNDSIHNQIYSCRVTKENDTMTTLDFIVTIYVPPDAVIAYVTRTGTARAGMIYRLTCMVSKRVGGLLYLPTATWSTADHAISSRNNVTSTTTTADTFTTSMLTFDPLRTSHGGIYTCVGNLNSTALNLPLISSVIEKHHVQIPPPVISIRDPPTSYHGTNFSLTAVVELDPYVDTNVTVTGIWSRGNDPQETIIMSSPYLTHLTFQPLTINNSGEYTFTCFVQPAENSLFIRGNSRNASFNLTVLPLPSRPPDITLASGYPSSHNGCGEARILNCTANQVDYLFSPSTIIWRGPIGTLVSSGRDSNPRIDPETSQLIFNSITFDNEGTYTCQSVVNIPQANILNHIDIKQVEAIINVPGMVQDLKCSSSSISSELSFSWKLPAVHGNEVIDLLVQVKGLRHRDGSREVVQFDVDSFYTEMNEATINQRLAGGVPYSITVRTRNLAGCGEERQIYCFTQDMEPPPPANVVVVRFDSTSIGVSWTKFTLVELKGLANYTVTYNVIIGSIKRQELGGTITVPWTENHVIISNLQSGVEYYITVSTATATAMSAAVGVTVDGEYNVHTSSDTSSIIGGVVAVVIVFILSVTAVVIITLYRIHRERMYHQNKRLASQCEPLRVTLSNVLNTNEGNQPTDNVDDDHEYEIINLSQAPDPPQKPKQKVGEYQLTNCPAYVPVSHGSQQAETLLMASHPDDGSSVEIGDGGRETMQ